MAENRPFFLASAANYWHYCGGRGGWYCNVDNLAKRQILIDGRKQNIEQIAQRLPGDVEVYSEMFSLETGLIKAIALPEKL